MAQRFYVHEPISTDRVTLTGPEAHHLLHVMRARAGDEVVLFDGSGFEFAARVDSPRRSEADLTVLGRNEVDRELPYPVNLGVALPKGDRQRWLVEKVVELGVTRLVPLRTQRSVAQPGAKAIERLQRSVIEACKQCGRNRLMEIAPAQDWPDFLVAHRGAAIHLVAHPSGDRRPLDFRSHPGGEVTIAVGPEGGLTDDEVALAVEKGWQLIGLGPRILRIETAALALVARVAGVLECARDRMG